MTDDPDESSEGGCPTPSKALFRSAAEAMASLLAADRPSPRTPLKAYRCRCGFWHLATDWG